MQHGVICYPLLIRVVYYVSNSIKNGIVICTGWEMDADFCIGNESFYIVKKFLAKISNAMPHNLGSLWHLKSHHIVYPCQKIHF